MAEIKKSEGDGSDATFTFRDPFKGNVRPQWFSYEVLQRIELTQSGVQLLAYEPGDCIIFMGAESGSQTLHRPAIARDLEQRGLIRARSPWTYKMDESDLRR